MKKILLIVLVIMSANLSANYLYLTLPQAAQEAPQVPTDPRMIALYQDYTVKVAEMELNADLQRRQAELAAASRPQVDLVGVAVNQYLADRKANGAVINPYVKEIAEQRLQAAKERARYADALETTKARQALAKTQNEALTEACLNNPYYSSDCLMIIARYEEAYYRANGVTYPATQGLTQYMYQTIAASLQ